MAVFCFLLAAELGFAVFLLLRLLEEADASPLTMREKLLLVISDAP